MREWLHWFDKKLMDSINGWSRKLTIPFLLITLIGNPIPAVGTACLITVTGWVRRDLALLSAGIICVTVCLIGMYLKSFLRRHRPRTPYVARMWLKTFSFPSGHALTSMVSYGYLTWVLSHTTVWPLDGLIAAAGTILIILIGVSRVYLGAHYPSDVIAGWMVGGAGLLLIILLGL